MDRKDGHTRRVRGSSLLPAALACIACGSVTLANVGDLDPGFGSSGRAMPAQSGPAWSIVSPDDESYVLAGGETGRWQLDVDEFRPSWRTVGFFAPITPTAAASASLDGVALLQSDVQVDGRLVGVGRATGGSNILVRTPGRGVAMRRNADGSPDTAFGPTGLVDVLDGADVDAALTGLTLEPDGRIVAVGYQDGRLRVRRLMPDGSVDAAFNSDATDVLEVLQGSYPKVLRAGASGYRVLLNDAVTDVPRCRVLALQTDGTVDQAWGVDGYASLGLGSGPTECRNIARTTGGKLLVVGAVDGRAWVTRLLAGGAVDPAFEWGDTPDLSVATAVLAPANEDRIYVAGGGPVGTVGFVVMRLMLDGHVDTLFGDAGRTIVDFGAGAAQANAMALTLDHALFAAGGLLSDGRLAPRPTVARLAGGDVASVGVVGVDRAAMEAGEGTTASIRVRRTGGGTGAVTIGYRTTASSSAAGDDYTPVQGQLAWGDGDRSDRTIEIPIAADHGGLGEEQESLDLELYDVTGGVLGTARTTLTIPPDGGNAGLVQIVASPSDIAEDAGMARVSIDRQYHSEGEISVTLRPVADTARAGDDFDAAPVVVTWTDGDQSPRQVDIPIHDDGSEEPAESFTVELSDVSGGAAIGPRARDTITILANDGPTPSDNSGGGGAGRGGSAEGSLLALCWLWHHLRRSRRHLLPTGR